MDRRTFLKASFAATSALATAGSLPQFAAAQGGKQPTLAFFVKNVTNPFWKACRIGAEKAGKELGATVETVAPAKPDNIEEQTRLVEDWIVKKPDAFVFVPVDYKALGPSIEKAIKAGIPVIGYSNRMPDIPQIAYVGCDDVTIGHAISKHVFESLGGKGKVIYIDGVPGAITSKDRKEGFDKAMKEFPGIELLAAQPAQYRRLPAVQVIENLMQRFPVIDAVVCANDDMAVGVVEALESAGRKQTKVGGINGDTDAAKLIKEGRMLATADYNGHDQGYLATVATIRHLRGQPVPKQIILPTKVAVQANVDPWLLPPEQRPVPKWDEVVAAQGKAS